MKFTLHKADFNTQLLEMYFRLITAASVASLTTPTGNHLTSAKLSLVCTGRLLGWRGSCSTPGRKYRKINQMAPSHRQGSRITPSQPTLISSQQGWGPHNQSINTITAPSSGRGHAIAPWTPGSPAITPSTPSSHLGWEEVGSGTVSGVHIMHLHLRNQSVNHNMSPQIVWYQQQWAFAGHLTGLPVISLMAYR